jgi:hypothetical protein
MKRKRKINRKALPKWQKILTADEIRHLRETGGNTKAGLYRNIEAAKETKFPCHICNHIARKIERPEDYR